MRVAVVHNRDTSGVINVFGKQNRERYNPRTVERVAKALEAGGHTVRVIDGNMHVIEQLQDFMPRVMAHERPGMVFNMAYGIQGVSRYTHLPAMLEMLGVPYVGSNPQAHAMALDKVVAKMVFQAHGLPTPGFWNFAHADEQFDDLEFPVIVKPKMEAVSYGLQIVDDWPALREAVATIIQEFGQHVLVEQFIRGREFAIGLLGNGDPEVLPIVEIDLEGDPGAIQTAQDKLRKPRGKLCPAPLDDDKADELRDLARRAFNSLELFDYSRVDLRMDADGRPYILEINSMASLGLTGTYVHAAQVAGYSFEALVNRILDVAAVRYFGSSAPSSEDARARAPVATEAVPPQQLSARIRSHVRSNAATMEESLRRMVDEQTPPHELERLSDLGRWLSGQLRALGFTVESVPRVGVADVLIYRNHSGEQDDVLLLGHLDTGAAGDRFASFREDGTRLYGTGVAEGKGGVAVLLGALRALRFARALRRLRVAILITSDETAGGAAARPLVEAAAARARHVLGLKAGEPDGSLIVSRSGRATYRLQSAFRRRRRDVTPEQILDHICNRVPALHDLTDVDRGVRVSVTRLEFNATFGRLPHRAEAAVTVRFNDPADAAAVEERMRRLANARVTPGIRLELTGGVRRPPLVQTDADRSLYEAVVTIGERMNQRLPSAHRWASADICFAGPDVPRLDGLGPVGGNSRSPDEYVLRHSLGERASLLALAMYYCATGKHA